MISPPFHTFVDGDTALILAAWYGHIEITRLLIGSHADVDATNCDGNCALNCAAYHGFMDVAMLLIDAGATIDVCDNVTGKTALIKAAYVGHENVADVLLRAGADRDAVDNQGYTALAFSTSFNHLGVLEVLLAAKANPNIQDEFGITPLIHSAARGCACLYSPQASVPAAGAPFPSPRPASQLASALSLSRGRLTWPCSPSLAAIDSLAESSVPSIALCDPPSQVRGSGSDASASGCEAVVDGHGGQERSRLRRVGRIRRRSRHARRMRRRAVDLQYIPRRH